ncbi:cytidylate kinase-like family protein [Zavarzinella formosa]|uniref:cytidylate kinase-like family protein n=1 Tax=Zavarzinella formosa TaxID=360055 RepID=UPI00031FA8F4|nr:cytidylate kinase-like family protein [Zavarzinella formosa]
MPIDPFIGPLHGNRGDNRERPGAPAGLTIAISRESGASGGSIARRVGQRLGWQVYTRELLEFLCANEAARQSILSDIPLDATVWVNTQLDRLRRDGRFPKDSDTDEMPRLLLSLASRGQVLVVGGGAGYYLPREISLHVRIIAPRTNRVAHMADWLRLSPEEAARQVQMRDERRAEFLLKRFGMRSAEPYDFDLVLNSGLLSEDTCTEAILAALKGKEADGQPDSRLD